MLQLLVIKMEKNKIWERMVSEAVLKYVAYNFKIPVEEIKKNFRFGIDLKPIQPPSLTEDVYEDLRLDLVLVMDKKTRKSFTSGKFQVTTVDEFCAQMMRCYRFNKTCVCSVLNISIGKRRKFLFLLRKILKRGEYRNIFYKIKKRFFRVGD